MNSSKQIKVGALLSYFSIGVNILSGLLYTPWMVNQIGQSNYGLYTLANSLISLLLVDFGLSSATARYLSKYNAEGDKRKAENFLGAVYKLYMLVDAVIFIALIVIFFRIDSIYESLTPDELSRFKVVYIISALFSVINFPFVTFNGILTAYEKFIPLKTADVIYRVFLVLFTVIALLLGYGLYALVAVHAAVGLIIIAFKFVVIKRSVPLKVNFRFKEKGLYKDIFGFSLWTTISALSQRLVFGITPTILGMVANAAEIAVFGVVTTIESYAYTITAAINGMFLPKISRIMSGEDKESNLTPLLISVGKFQYALNGVIIAGFAVVGKSFINLWMGPEYIDAYYGILLVLVPGIFFNSLQIANTTMVVTKKVNLMAVVNVITGVTNICLSYPLSKMYGVIGACSSIAAAYMLRAIVLLIIYNKVLPVNMGAFIKQCYIKMSVPIALTIGAGIALNMIFGDDSWLALVIRGIVVVGVYGVVAFIVGFNKSEKTAILSKAKKLVKKFI